MITAEVTTHKQGAGVLMVKEKREKGEVFSTAKAKVEPVVTATP